MGVDLTASYSVDVDDELPGHDDVTVERVWASMDPMRVDISALLSDEAMGDVIAACLTDWDEEQAALAEDGLIEDGLLALEAA